jgi:hypothetical protein
LRTSRVEKQFSIPSKKHGKPQNSAWGRGLEPFVWKSSSKNMAIPPKIQNSVHQVTFKVKLARGYQMQQKCRQVSVSQLVFA